MSAHREVLLSVDIRFPAKRYGWGWGLPSAWQGGRCWARTCLRSWLPRCCFLSGLQD